jgi:hypothetical protein
MQTWAGVSFGRRPSFSAAMSQKMQCSEIFLGKPRPALAVTCRPKIAGQASVQALAVIVYLDKFLPTVMATLHAAHLRVET